MILTEQKFNRLRYPVLEKVDYLDRFPDLAKYPQFHADFAVDRDSLIKYIILVYSPESPLNDEIANYIQRKIKAADIAGLSVSDQNVKQIISCKDSNANKAIIAYLRHIKDHKVAKLCVYTDTYYRKLSELQAGGDEKDKDTLANIDKIEAEIDKLLAHVLADDKSVELREELMEYVEDTLLKLKPEDIALARQEGKDPLDGFTPYSND